MERKDFPKAAFGYVKDEQCFLLHHDPERVKSGKEHETVDLSLLTLALHLVAAVPMTDAERDRTRRHLETHANVLLWTDPASDGLPIALHDKLREFAFFKANLDGVGEVPPVQTEARGTAYILYDKRTREMSWMVNYLGLSSTETAAHFHIGKAGKLGDITISVQTGNPKQGNVTLTEAQAKDLFEGNLYLNIHSAAYPVGEIRGQVIPSAVSRSNNSETDAGAHLPGQKKKKKDKDKGSEAAQIKPPKERDPKAQTPHLQPGKGENGNGAVYSGKDQSTDAKQIVPPDSPPRNPGAMPSGQIRPDALGPANKNPGPGTVTTPPQEVKPKGQKKESLQVEKNRKSGGGGPDVITPPKEVKPKADVRQVHKQTDRGAILSREQKDGKQKPNVEVRTTHKQGDKGAVYSGRVDFAQPLVNILVDPEQPLSADETARRIMENGNSTGAPNQPPAATDQEKAAGLSGGVPRVTMSNLADKNNTDLRKIIDEENAARSSAPGRPGPGSTKLRERVVSLLSDKQFRGRVVIFQVTGGDKKKDYAVLRMEADPQILQAINDLPDSAFAVIERGGRKDGQGRTIPRNFRHLPYKNADSSIDLPRLRNALSRMNQVQANNPSDNTSRIRQAARTALIKAAKAHLPDGVFADKGKVSLQKIIAEFDKDLLERSARGEIPVTAQLMEVKKESVVKLFRLRMGSKERPVTFFVRVREDGAGNTVAVEFEFDTFLPARAIPDFAKFLKGLKIPKET